MLKTISAVLSFMVLCGLVITPVASQSGHGVVIEANPQGALNSSIDPLICTSLDCWRLINLLYPTLFAVDPRRGVIEGAGADNVGLVVDPTLDEGNEQVLVIRDDLRWSDGSAVSGYDVLFSLLFHEANGYWLPEIDALWLDDPQQVRIVYSDAADCSTFARSNLLVAPVHMYRQDFPAFVDTFQAEHEASANIDEWRRAFERFDYPRPRQDAPPITAGLFELDSIRPFEAVRLRAGETGFIYRDIPVNMNRVELFLEGMSTILVNPPYEQRDNLRTRPDIQIAEYAGQTWVGISFNVADPTRPRDAYKPSGELYEQGKHPIFGDARVRQAFQMGIDVREVIEVAYEGNATPLATHFLPRSWAFDASVEASVYDPAGAGRLLDEAGWKDANNDGIRECRGCLYASDNQPLTVQLTVQNGLELQATLIARQLRAVGFNVQTGGNAAESQQHDAYLSQTSVRRYDDPDPSALYGRAADVVQFGTNYGSYYNAEIERLMEEARQVPGCDVETRTALYHQIQQMLRDDPPAAWLFAPNEMVAVQGGVQGFQPYPDDPLWNIRDWVVLP